MKEALTSFDLRVLSRELSEIEGAYLDKVYQKESSFILKFNLPGAGRREVLVEPGKWLFIGEDLEKPSEPPPLAQGIRKVLSNALLREVSQRGFDRVLLMRFERETEYTLVLEMFGKGNLVLLRGEEVLHALRYGKWKAREVRRGRPYALPPAFKDPTSLDLEGFTQFMGSQEGSLVRALASGLGLGGLYAEETCLRAAAHKSTPVQRLTPEQVKAVYKALSELLAALDTPDPRIVLREGPVDAVPFPLEIYKDLDSKGFATMSGALREYVSSVKEKEPEDEASARIERRIERQEESLRELEIEIERLGVAAEYLYSNYQKVEKLLTRAQEGTNHEGVDRIRGTMRIEADGADVELDYKVDVDGNAKLLYERRKALSSKLAGVKKALEVSRASLVRAQSAEVPARDVPSFKLPKRFWFDAYRWSLTSGGYVILAGRDARSNEKLVKKHLEPGDRYCHADLTGAPSVILKGGSQASEEDLREACRFALVMSKAWKAGVGSGSAYWVTPEQVSKTAQSGEYLRTGSFVVRGKRNHFTRLDLTTGVGRIEYQGVARVIAADPEAMRKMSDSYVVLDPGGPLHRSSLVRQLSTAFRVPLEEVDKVLPVGRLGLREVKGLELTLREKD